MRNRNQPSFSIGRSNLATISLSVSARISKAICDQAELNAPVPPTNRVHDSWRPTSTPSLIFNSRFLISLSLFAICTNLLKQPLSLSHFLTQPAIFFKITSLIHIFALPIYEHFIEKQRGGRKNRHNCLGW